MDFRHLKYFIAVAEELNIGRAAVRLHISQPPLTRQIQQLEEELGVQLFIRTPRGVELTHAGEVFLDEARNVRSLVEQAIEKTKRAGEGKLGRLDIGIFGTGIISAIPKMLQLFRATYPDVRVVLHTMSKDEQIEALRQKRLNVAFNRMIKPLADISSEVILREPLFLAMHESNPLASREAVSFMEVGKHPLILYPTGTPPNFVDKVMELCRHRGFTPEVSQIVGDAMSAIALVAGGFGITIVSESAITLQLPGIVYRPFEDAAGVGVDLSCIYRKDDQSTILHVFLDLIRGFSAQQLDHQELATLSAKTSEAK